MKISATQTGFALYKEADVIGRCDVTPTPKGADITALSVLPQWRRKGYGSYLLKEILRRFGGYDREAATVFTAPLPADEGEGLFWQKFGFAPEDGRLVRRRTPDLTAVRFVQDYQVHLIDPARLSEEELAKFSTSLREVMGYIKYSKDKKKLSEFLKENPRMLIEANAARVIKAVTNTPLDIPEDAEVVDMCKAVEDMMNESKTKGAVEVLVGLVKDGVLSIREAASRAHMTESAFEEEVKKLS